MDLSTYIIKIVEAIDTDMVESILFKINDKEKELLLHQLNKIKFHTNKKYSTCFVKNINRAIEILE